VPNVNLDNLVSLREIEGKEQNRNAEVEQLLAASEAFACQLPT
jgi:hypothetical protein